MACSMATDRSYDSSSAPMDFHLSSSTDDCSRFLSHGEKCPLCKKCRDKFYCRDCVRRGDFFLSTALMEDSFSELQVQLQRKRRLRAEVQESCETILRKKERAEKLRKDVDACKERIELLKSTLSLYKDDIVSSNPTSPDLSLSQTKFVSDRSKARHLSNEISNRSHRLPIYAAKVFKLIDLVADTNKRVEMAKRAVLIHQQSIKSVVQRRAKELLQYIFPITEVIPQSKCDQSESMEETVSSAIAEASKMTFLRGQWVSSDCSGEVHHRIVAPTLPTSGDYSAYSMWIATNKDGVPGAGVPVDKIEMNHAYTITAALTYTAQLVNVLAFYLDVRLPKKQHYSDFCKAEMTDMQFARRVARLNANILHLCFSQSIPPSVLHPTRTLHNLLQLFNRDVSNLGRQGYVEVDTDLVRSLEDQLIRELEMLDGDDDETCSDGEDGDCLPGGWESVPSLPYQESGAGALTDSRALVSAQGSVVNTSVAGGLVTSAAATIASIWRGWRQ